MKIYKSVWHADLWEANNCEQEDINSFFEVFNRLAKELLVWDDDLPKLGYMDKRDKFLVRTQVDRVHLLRLRCLHHEPFDTPCSLREGLYSKIINAMPLVITPQGIDYIFFPDTSSQ